MPPPQKLLRWTEAPGDSRVLLAAVVWLPDGPALATVERGAERRVYLGRIADRLVAGARGSPRACREAIVAAVFEATVTQTRSAQDAD